MLKTAFVILDMKSLCALAVVCQRNTGENCPERFILDLVLDLAAEVVCQLLRVGRGDNVMIRIPTKIPCRKELTGQHRFAVAWRHRDHQPADLATLDRFKLACNQSMMCSIAVSRP